RLKSGVGCGGSSSPPARRPLPPVTVTEAAAPCSWPPPPPQAEAASAASRARARGARRIAPESTRRGGLRCAEPAYGFGRQTICAAAAGQVMSKRLPTTRWNSIAEPFEVATQAPSGDQAAVLPANERFGSPGRSEE